MSNGFAILISISIQVALKLPNPPLTTENQVFSKSYKWEILQNTIF